MGCLGVANPDSKNTRDQVRRRLKAELDTLYSISLEWKEKSGKEVKSYAKMRIAEAHNYIKNGDLKAVKMGKYWRVSEANLQDFIEHGTKKKG